MKYRDAEYLRQRLQMRITTPRKGPHGVELINRRSRVTEAVLARPASEPVLARPASNPFKIGDKYWCFAAKKYATKTIPLNVQNVQCTFRFSTKLPTWICEAVVKDSSNKRTTRWKALKFERDRCCSFSLKYPPIRPRDHSMRCYCTAMLWWRNNDCHHQPRKSALMYRKYLIKRDDCMHNLDLQTSYQHYETRKMSDTEPTHKRKSYKLQNHCYIARSDACRT